MMQSSEIIECIWFVVEPRDRWYRALCRFVPSKPEHGIVSRISRVQPASAAGLVSRMKSTRGQSLVIWAIDDAAESSNQVETIDLIASIRSEVPSALQFIAASSRWSLPWQLAAHEAGAVCFLESIESLPMVQKLIERSSHLNR